MKKKKLPPMPGAIYLIDLRSNHMDQIVVRFTFPPPGAPDVVERHFLAMKNGHGGPLIVHQVFNLPLPSVFEWTFDQGQVVHLHLYDVDDSGNQSPIRMQDFVALDTIPPPMPGEVLIENIAEIPAP